MNEFTVAGDTGALSNSLVTIFDVNWVFEIPHRKGQRVEESVVSLRDPLAHGVVRQMAIVADGNMVVAGMLPRIKMVLHDVAIDARLRIITQITGTFAIAKGKRSQAEQRAEKCGEND